MSDQILEGDKMSVGIGKIVNQALKMLVASGKLNKVEVFADLIGWSQNQLTKRLHGFTSLTLDDFWLIAAKVKELDPDTTYLWLIRSILMDFEIDCH